jgi:hypothetical protein
VEPEPEGMEQRSASKKTCNKAGTEVGEKEDMWRGKKVVDLQKEETRVAP